MTREHQELLELSRESGVGVEIRADVVWVGSHGYRGEARYMGAIIRIHELIGDFSPNEFKALQGIL